MQSEYRLMHSVVMALIISFPSEVRACPQERATESLTLEEVVRLHHAGFADEVIATKIKKNGKPFDLSTDELVDLKKEGITDGIIKCLLDPAQPYVAPTPPGPKSLESLKKYPPDILATLVPTDSGLYVFAGESPSSVELQTLLGKREGGSLMKKAHIVAYLVGPSAKFRLRSDKPAFYLRLPEGKDISDFILTTVVQKQNLRELNMEQGPKPQIKPESIRQFDATEVGPRLVKLVPQTLHPGEYVFLILGTADPSKATFGKGYDIGIDQPLAPPKK